MIQPYSLRSYCQSAAAALQRLPVDGDGYFVSHMPAAKFSLVVHYEANGIIQWQMTMAAAQKRVQVRKN